MTAPHDRSFLRGAISFRSPRSVALMNPYQIPAALSLLGVSIVFTFWPSVLGHSPVSFEKLGLVHHVWHYALLMSSVLTLVGMFATATWRLKTELIGLIGLIGTLGMNLVAVTADGLSSNPQGSSLSGIGLAALIALIGGLTVRAFIVATEQTVDLRDTTTTLGG